MLGGARFPPHTARPSWWIVGHKGIFEEFPKLGVPFRGPNKKDYGKIGSP